MAKKKSGSGRWLIVAGVVALGALSTVVFLTNGCKKESASQKAGREARETFEKSKELFKEGLDKTKDLTKEGLEKGGEAAKEGLEKSQEAAKAFSKGWKEGGK